MDLVDSKFIGLISPRLQKFKKIKSDLYNLGVLFVEIRRRIRVKLEDICMV